MIGYIMLGTNDLDRATKFYEDLLSHFGAKQAMTDPGRFVGWSDGKGPMLAVTKPHDGNKATFGNGTMIALAADSQETVNKVHAKALSLGGTDEGAPGLRGGTFYGGYFRDLDGNKLVVFHM
ncbi:MAG: VOC family protein [Parvibaculum sp.]|uniref:VOC family protein n=1 Tax=Parvibaculum sp. TaxID=2024848 RepID=UPI002AB83321|nr:VOC family protein [Parvibaculum sp.]MDZ4381804.1 VOC family protein [Parvibaculum sp.]